MRITFRFRIVLNNEVWKVFFVEPTRGVIVYEPTPVIPPVVHVNAAICKCHVLETRRVAGVSGRPGNE